MASSAFPGGFPYLEKMKANSQKDILSDGGCISNVEVIDAICDIMDLEMKKNGKKLE